MSKEEKLKVVALGMATAGMETFELDSSSSSSSDDSSKRLENFAEVVVPSFSDDLFRRHKFLHKLFHIGITDITNHNLFSRAIYTTL